MKSVLTFLIVLSLCSMIVSGAAVSNWTLNEGSGATGEDIISGYNVTFANSYGWTTDVPTYGHGGSVGNHSVWFDGINGFGTVSDTADLRLGGNITVSMRVKSNQSAITAAKTVLDKAVPGSSQGWMVYTQTDELIYFFTYGLSDNQINSVSNLNDTDFHHVVFTYNGSNKSIYWDGVLESSELATGTVTSSTTDLYFAYYSDAGSNKYFNGTISDVRIDNAAWTSEQVLSYYNCGQVTPCIDQWVITAPDDCDTINNLSVYIYNMSAWYNTSNGTVWTDINHTAGTTDLLIISDGYYNNSLSNISMATNYEATMSAIPLTQVVIDSPSPGSEQTDIMTVNWTGGNSGTGQTVYFMVNLTFSGNGTIRNITNTTSKTLNYSLTDLPYANMTIIVHGYEMCRGSNNSDSNWFWSYFNYTDYYFYVYDYLGLDLVSPLTIETMTGESNANPYISQPELNWTEDMYNMTVWFNVTDDGLMHRNSSTNCTYTLYSYNCSINMTANSLILSFYENGTSVNTSGDIWTNEDTRQWENASIVIVHQDLPRGLILVRFGDNISIPSWNQFYEYFNTYGLSVDEDIEILTNGSTDFYVRVLDYSNAVVDNATVRVFEGWGNMTDWDDYDVFGQRITDDDGYVMFYGDDDTVVYYTVSKDGYMPVTGYFSLRDVDYTKADPLIVYLEKERSFNSSKVFVGSNLTFYYDTTDSINFVYYYQDYSLLSYSTTYRDNHSLGKRDISCTTYRYCTFTMYDGTDYDADDSSFTLYIYGDSVVIGNVTMYKETDYESDYFTGIYDSSISDYINLLLGIVLIVSVLLVTAIFRSETISIGTFLGGSVLLGFVSSMYYWMLLPALIYVAGRIFYKVVSE